MGYLLIGQRVRFWYYVREGDRIWYLNDKYHRGDGGPAYEEMSSGYCELVAWSMV